MPRRRCEQKTFLVTLPHIGGCCHNFLCHEVVCRTQYKGTHLTGPSPLCLICFSPDICLWKAYPFCCKWQLLAHLHCCVVSHSVNVPTICLSFTLEICLVASDLAQVQLVPQGTSLEALLLHSLLLEASPVPQSRAGAPGWCICFLLVKAASKFPNVLT